MPDLCSLALVSDFDTTASRLQASANCIQLTARCHERDCNRESLRLAYLELSTAASVALGKDANVGERSASLTVAQHNIVSTFAYCKRLL